MAQLIVLLPLGIVFTWFAFTIRGPLGSSGDEPHYLAYTQSLLLYHTVDQKPVLYHHDYYLYYPYPMSSHAVPYHGGLYSLHYLGLPLVLLPGFALASVTGARLTVLAIALLVCWRMLRLAARIAGPIAAGFTVLALGLSAPFALNAGTIYPDLLSGLLIILAYETLDVPSLTPRRALALGAILGAMPWVHVKLISVMCLYMIWTLVALWVQWARPRMARRRGAWQQRYQGALPGIGQTLALGAISLGLPVLSMAGLMLFNRAFYGSPSPAAPYHGPSFFTGNPLGGMIGQIFSQGQGALGTAPFMLLAIPGMAMLWRRDRVTALKIAFITVPFWLATLTYRDWWGGDAPPLRYLLPMFPLWAVAIALLIARLRTILSGLVIAFLAAWTVALTVVAPSAPRTGWPLPRGIGGLVLALGRRIDLPLTGWMPAFEAARTGPGTWHNTILIPLWALILLSLWAVLASWEKKKASA